MIGQKVYHVFVHFLRRDTPKVLLQLFNGEFGVNKMPIRFLLYPFYSFHSLCRGVNKFGKLSTMIFWRRNFYLLLILNDRKDTSISALRWTTPKIGKGGNNSRITSDSNIPKPCSGSPDSAREAATVRAPSW